MVLGKEPLQPPGERPIPAVESEKRHVLDHTFEKAIADDTNDSTQGKPPRDIGLCFQRAPGPYLSTLLPIPKDRSMKKARLFMAALALAMATTACGVSVTSPELMIDPGGNHGAPIDPGGNNGAPIDPGGNNGAPIDPGGNH